MQLNAIFPTRDIGTDPERMRDWAQAAESLGFAMIEVSDHVLGATARDGWTPNYDERDPFHETFVTLGFLAAVTKRIRLSSSVLVLPQRQTALVAKQAAQVDIVSGGRLRLGVGVGWNHVEYEALGVDWSTRGARQAEQIGLMRRLWSGELVTFDGRFDRMRDVCINPAPIQRPIPIWLGGTSPAAIGRAARLGDGWLPIFEPHHDAEALVGELDRHLAAAGRSRSGFGLECWIRADRHDPDAWAERALAYAKLGADMIMLRPMYRLFDLDDQIDMLRAFKAAVRGALPDI
jgi:probable F420-dependent oxidoreductase